ncbi:MAG: endonuclease III, partial [Firmicutes bacterium]|nr:endonuclease III [Bacillota bacterium]
YIHHIGMYKTKSANVKRLSQMLVSQFGGQVPGDFEQLVTLPGVGRKTANVVLGECFGVPTIAVDTHVFRLANRIGFAKETDVVKTEERLMKVLPKENWTQLHHAIIWHGRRVCSARKPACEGCCLDGICKKNGVK